MKVEILSREEIERYVWEEQAQTSVIVSISSIGTSHPMILMNSLNKVREVLRVSFNDTEVDDEYSGGIEDEQAKAILDFYIKYRNSSIDKFIIHCGAGISRSAGVGAALLTIEKGDASEIFNNDKYKPNMLCYKKIIQQSKGDKEVKDKRGEGVCKYRAIDNNNRIYVLTK